MKTRKEYSAPVFIGQNVYVKPSYLVSIPEFFREGGNQPSLDFMANMANLEENDNKGKLSRKAITGLKNSINWLCISARKKRVYVKSKGTSFEFKVNFVTLTLPDTKEPINNQDLQKNLLNPFLTYMRKYHNLRNYVWRLEFQANGKLHVHLSADTFLHYQIIRDTWNRLLDKNGYLDDFCEKNRHKDPNSTDVHATRKVKNMAAYIAKYMSKQGSVYQYPLKTITDKINAAVSVGVSDKGISSLVEKKKLILYSPVRTLAKGIEILKGEKVNGKFNSIGQKRWYLQRVNFWNSPFNPRPIKGRIWGCSKELSKANKTVVHVPANECAQDLKCLMNPEIRFKEIFSKPVETIHSRFNPDALTSQPQKIGEVYFLTASDWFTKINGSIRRKFEDVRQSVAALTDCLTFELN